MDWDEFLVQLLFKTQWCSHSNLDHYKCKWYKFINLFSREKEIFFPWKPNIYASGSPTSVWVRITWGGCWLYRFKAPSPEILISVSLWWQSQDRILKTLLWAATATPSNTQICLQWLDQPTAKGNLRAVESCKKPREIMGFMLSSRQTLLLGWSSEKITFCIFTWKKYFL